MSTTDAKPSNPDDGDSTETQLIKPLSMRNLIDGYPELRPVVIEGILRRGETANIIAAAKIGKTYLVYLLAWCIVTGMSWLSHAVTKGRVLIIDNELHPETLAHRLDWIANKLMINRSDYADTIDVITLRGQNINIHDIERRLATIKPGTYSLVIIDALYRTIPQGTSENDNAMMMAIYNKLDYYASASQWDCAIAVVHHSSKGQQGDKQLTDVGAGAGSISRAADTHIVIRPHEDEGLSVLECVTRSFKSPDPVSIQFDCPLWQAVTSEPQVKQAGRQAQEAKAKEDKADSEAMLAKIPMSPKAIQQNKLFDQFPHGAGKAKRLIGILVQAEKIRIREKAKPGGSRKLVFYSQMECSSECSSEGSSGMISPELGNSSSAIRSSGMESHSNGKKTSGESDVDLGMDF